MSKQSVLLLAVLALALVAIPTVGTAAQVTLEPAQDNSIYQDNPNNSNGAGTRIFAGNNASEFHRRALLQFDVAGNVPAGAVITSASLTVTVAQTFSATVRTHTLHRLLQTWGEAGTIAFSGQGGGAPAGAGDATWNNAFHPSTPWSGGPGGNFSGTTSASASVGGIGTSATFTGLASDVQDMLDNPGSNFGWLMQGEETGIFTAHAFHSREGATPASRPQLTIEYSLAVPQTITIDGINDFDSANLIDADSSDTEVKDWGCGVGSSEAPLDFGNIYLTNDANFLYFGFDYDRFCFCDINLGLAIDIKNTVAGGTSDAFSRQIAWNNVPFAPDFYVYDVIPTNCNTFNYEVLYEWSGSAWSVVADGPDGLGIADADGGAFKEGRLSLSTLGLAAGDTLNIEFWVTQDGTTKPPLDAACSDDIQLSTPGGTTFDVGSPVEMSCMFPYIVQADADTVDPVVESATAVGFATLGDGSIALTTDKIDVKFSESVGTGADTPGNYSGLGVVSSAVIDGSDASIVHLTLASPVGASDTRYDVTVTGVQDLAGNGIDTSNSRNVGTFFIKKLRFEGDMSIFLLTNSSPPDTFAVEGSLSPLTFNLLDNALMQGPGADSVYVALVPMTLGGNGDTGIPDRNLAWKFSHQVADYEPRSNRDFLVSAANTGGVLDGGECDTVFAFWNDDDPGSVTDKAIDVCFQVDVSSLSPTATDSVTIVGNQDPLPDFALLGTFLNDDGTGADQTPGDEIYAVYVRFPVGTFKDVEYKFKFNNAFECTTQGNRNVFLNDAVFDTVGGANGPLVLPPRGINACEVTDKAVAVNFRLDLDYFFPTSTTIDSAQVSGTASPANRDSFYAFAELLDDGLLTDLAAADDTFSVQFVFPEGVNQTLRYKYLVNGEFECLGFPDREVFLDDVNFDSVTPIIPPVAVWNYCSDVVGVPEDGRPGRPVVTIHLAQNYPNPFASRTSIEFRASEAGRARVDVFDVAGRLVDTILDREVNEGLQVVQWNGKDRTGRDVSPGIYFYSVTQGEERATKRMILLD